MTVSGIARICQQGWWWGAKAMEQSDRVGEGVGGGQGAVPPPTVGKFIFCTFNVILGVGSPNPPVSLLNFYSPINKEPMTPLSPPMIWSPPLPP